jgi:hypothetical protein
VAESKASQATSFTLTAAKERFFFFPCAQYINYGILDCLLSFDCVMRQFVLYHLIKAPALFLMCLLLGYV